MPYADGTLTPDELATFATGNPNAIAKVMLGIGAFAQKNAAPQPRSVGALGGLNEAIMQRLQASAPLSAAAALYSPNRGFDPGLAMLARQTRFSDEPPPGQPIKLDLAELNQLRGTVPPNLIQDSMEALQRLTRPSSPAQAQQNVQAQAQINALNAAQGRRPSGIPTPWQKPLPKLVGPQSNVPLIGSMVDAAAKSAVTGGTPDITRLGRGLPGGLVSGAINPSIPGAGRLSDVISQSMNVDPRLQPGTPGGALQRASTFLEDTSDPAGTMFGRMLGEQIPYMGALKIFQMARGVGIPAEVATRIAREAEAAAEAKRISTPAEMAGRAAEPMPAVAQTGMMDSRVGGMTGNLGKVQGGVNLSPAEAGKPSLFPLTIDDYFNTPAAVRLPLGAVGGALGGAYGSRGQSEEAYRRNVMAGAGIGALGAFAPDIARWLGASELGGTAQRATMRPGFTPQAPTDPIPLGWMPPPSRISMPTPAQVARFGVGTQPVSAEEAAARIAAVPQPGPVPEAVAGSLMGITPEAQAIQIPGVPTRPPMGIPTPVPGLPESTRVHSQMVALARRLGIDLPSLRAAIAARQAQQGTMLSAGPTAEEIAGRLGAIPQPGPTPEAVAGQLADIAPESQGIPTVAVASRPPVGLPVPAETAPAPSPLLQSQAEAGAARFPVPPSPPSPLRRVAEANIVQYPRAQGISDSRVIRSEIPNLSSIESSLNSWYEVPGIRDVPLSDFQLTGKHYSVAGTKRINQLAEQIKKSGEINPLIVVIDKDGPYILEGANRAEALYKLGAKSLPAKVVIDTDPETGVLVPVPGVGGRPLQGGAIGSPVSAQPMTTEGGALPNSLQAALSRMGVEPPSPATPGALPTAADVARPVSYPPSNALMDAVTAAQRRAAQGGIATPAALRGGIGAMIGAPIGGQAMSAGQPADQQQGKWMQGALGGGILGGLMGISPELLSGYQQMLQSTKGMAGLRLGAAGGLAGGFFGYQSAAPDDKLAGTLRGVGIGSTLGAAVAPGSILTKLLSPITNRISEALPATTSIENFPKAQVMNRPAAVGEVVGLLRNANTFWDETNALRHQQLGEIAANMREAQKTADSPEALAQIQKMLSGERAIGDIPPMENQVTPQQLSDLIRYINQSPATSKQLGVAPEFSKQRVSLALTDLIGKGTIPNESTIEQMGKFLGQDFTNELLRLRGKTNPGEWAQVMNAMGMTKALTASYDLSALGRQGWVYMVTHPRVGANAFVTMVKAAMHPDVATGMMNEINGGPEAAIGERFGLHISPLDNMSPLGMREEPFQTNLPARLARTQYSEVPLWLKPLVAAGKGYAASERGYVVGLQKLRMDVWSGYVDALTSAGLKPDNPADQVHFSEAAKLVNTLTGRGTLGAAEPIAPILNGFMFSPRFVSSRIQAPLMALTSPSKQVRGMAQTELLKFVGLQSTVLALGNQAGLWDVELDPRSSEFGQMRIGDRHYDPWAGWSPIVRIIARVAEGSSVGVTGKDNPFNAKAFSSNDADEMIRFMRGKLSPVASAATDLAYGKTLAGQPVTATDTLGHFVPMALSDMSSSVAGNDILSSAGAALMSSPSFFGMGYSEYVPRPGVVRLMERANRNDTGGMMRTLLNMDDQDMSNFFDKGPATVAAANKALAAAGRPTMSYDTLKQFTDRALATADTTSRAALYKKVVRIVDVQQQQALQKARTAQAQGVTQ